MMPVLITLLLVVLLPAVWVIVQYNWLVSLRNYISESWSNVDTELKRRYDLIPNLVATVKGYAAHERAVLERVTELRARCVANNGSPAEQARDEVQLVDALKQLLVVVENYPLLKSDATFARLMDELAGTENRIAVERMRYNEQVQAYNTSRRQFPANITAAIFGFKGDYPLFTAPESAKVAPKVDFKRPTS